MGNHLANEISPYLLQHAGNPVDWYPWGEEAFAKAKKENKPVFLSIGYSTCHWCHVMAHESFEDCAVAKIMNENVISVKVDREEQPDIDMVYMKVCQLMTGSGGWPLTIIMTPDKEPFFAATYIPKETSYGRIGLLELIPWISEIWNTRQTEVLKTTAQVTEALLKTRPQASKQTLSDLVLHTAYQQLLESYDEKNGGFGTEPKFPTPHNLLFLLRYWKRTGRVKALEMVDKTLTAMRRGGIYDQLGFGFHRYSTDAEWRVPHFEKMLYDQAMLAIAYTESYQATRKEEYKNTACEVLGYVLRDMTAPEGGFYSAEDADSEDEEGKFYLWTKSEIEGVLSPEEAAVFNEAFNISKNGNFQDEINNEKRGLNILFTTKSINEISADLETSPAELPAGVEMMRRKLFDYRQKRIHPHKDDKVLTDWNGLMIAALAKASQVFHEPRFVRSAVRAADFILDNRRDSAGRLLHCRRSGGAGLKGNADDYAFFIYGLLDLYETVFDVKYLKVAIQLNYDFIDHFWDKVGGGFYFTADDEEKLLIRQKEIHDGAIPSGNSIAAVNLLRLGRITANPDLEKKTEEIGRTFYSDISNLPVAYSQFLISLDFALGPSYEVIVAGDLKSKDTEKMLCAIRSEFIPDKVVILHPTELESPEIDRIAPFIKNYLSIRGEATAYVCRNFSCALPTTDLDIMLKLLSAQSV